MKLDKRTPTGVRITTAEQNGKTTLFLNRTAKSGTAQNARHTAIEPLRTKIVNDLDPAVIGKAVLEELDIDWIHKP